MKYQSDDYAANSDDVAGQPHQSKAKSRSLPSLVSVDESITLMRCSLVRKFDKPLFSRYFQSGDAQWENLIERRWIETDKRDNTQYWVSRRLRGAAWQLWWQDGTDPSVVPAELRARSAEVAGYCEQNGWHIEQLRQEAVADPAQADALFKQLFQEADERFDLAYCQDLVDALTEEDRASFIPQALRDSRDAAQRRITTRALRDSDYYQTRDRRFQPRTGAQDALRGLLTPAPDYWLLQMHGTGGIGKTTLLRWFVSRACVTPDQTVPAAVINCDDFDAAAILSQPWRLLIEVADQLNDQLPRVPFRDLVDDRNRPSQGISIASAATGDPRWPARIGRQVEDTFCANASTGIPFVIVLDGLDLISIESRAEPTALRELVDLLRRVHDRVHDLRVVLSGRDDLSALVPQLAGEPVRTHEVRKFSDSEIGEYLGRRGIKEPDKVTAIKDKSDGLPMVVGLYADWLATDQKITARKIAENSKPQVTYLVTRILSRIPDKIVRLALLHSVTPASALDFEFFQDVLLPGWKMPPPTGSQHDGLDLGPPPDPAEVPTDIAAQDQLWAEVLQRAEQAKWISAVDVGGEKVVRVHADVRLELLAQLCDDDTVRRIHVLAAGHYQRRADNSQAEEQDSYGAGSWQPGAIPGLAAEPDTSWPALTARVLYHHIRSGDPAAIGYWRDAVRQSRDKGRIDWVREIAGLVIRQPDFLDATLVRPGKPLSPSEAALPGLSVLLPILYECHVELARVTVQAAGLLPGPYTVALVPEISLSAVTIDNAHAVRRAAAANGLEISRADYDPVISALNAVTRYQYDEALRELDAVGEIASGAGTAAGDGWLVRARAYAGHYRVGDSAAAADNLGMVTGAFTAALRAHAGNREAATYVAVSAAQWLLSVDRPDQALSWCDRAPEAWLAAHPAGTAAELKAQALLALGRPGHAIEVLSPPAAQVSTAACSLAVAAHLALHRPALAMAEDSGPEDDLPSRRIERKLRGAEAARELLDPDTAEACFGEAQACLLLLGQADEGFQARINTAQALFELRAMGNIQKAQAYLRDEFDLVSVGWPTWTEYQLARVEMADRRGRGVRVAAILDEVFGKLRDIEAPVSARVTASIVGLTARSAGPLEHRKYLQSLVGELGQGDTSRPHRAAQSSHSLSAPRQPRPGRPAWRAPAGPGGRQAGRS